MNNKDLAEAILNGEFNYKPNDDTIQIAKAYLQLLKDSKTVLFLMSDGQKDLIASSKP